MKRRILFLIMMIISISAFSGEFDSILIGARSISLGGAYTAVSDDATAIFHNPAGLMLVPKLEVTSVHEKIFDLEDLRTDFFSIAQPIRRLEGVFALSYLRMGNHFYSEKTYVAAYARKFFERGRMGFAFKDYVSRIHNTPDHYAVGLDLGFQYDVTSRVMIGGHIRNINTPDVNEEIPMVSHVGLSLKPTDNILVSLEASKETNREVKFHIGQEYWISKSCALRGGYATNPGRLSAGIGFKIFNWKIDYAYQDHPVLENTHTIQLSMDFDAFKVRRERVDGTKKANTTDNVMKTQMVSKDFVKKEEPVQASATIEEIQSEKVSLIEIPKININLASPEDLVKLPGITRKIANNIALYRYIHGKFNQHNQIRKVPGINDTIYEKILKYIEL